jgi:hypothetical protein
LENKETCAPVEITANLFEVVIIIKGAIIVLDDGHEHLSRLQKEEKIQHSRQDQGTGVCTRLLFLRLLPFAVTLQPLAYSCRPRTTCSCM